MYGISLGMAAIHHLASLPMDIEAMSPITMINKSGPGRKSSARISTGKTYPHSNKRQQARYARQIAAGQLRMIGVDDHPITE